MRWLVVSSIWLAAAAQQIGQNAAPGASASATFTTSTQLVVEAVAVTDKKGNAIEGLTAKDFTITEDGIPQEIRFFEHEKLGEAPAQTMPSAPERIRIFEKLGQTRIAPEAPGSTRYKDRRLLALYF